MGRTRSSVYVCDFILFFPRKGWKIYHGAAQIFLFLRAIARFVSACLAIGFCSKFCFYVTAVSDPPTWRVQFPWLSMHFSFSSFHHSPDLFPDLSRSWREDDVIYPFLGLFPFLSHFRFLPGCVVFPPSKVVFFLQTPLKCDFYFSKGFPFPRAF